MSLITNRKRPRGFSGTFEVKSNGYYDYYNTVFDDDDFEDDIDETIDGEQDQPDDEVVILEERSINNYRLRPKRNNSDSIIYFDNDSFNALKLLNVNNNSIDVIDIKKQRTNSLPQLPPVKCNYEKIPSSYILGQEKVRNIKTNVIPFNNNSPSCDDKDGHFIIELNSVFANRFIILELLGQGTFGKVIKCFDKMNKENVAIKVIRNIPKYRDAAKIELRVLATLKKFDDKNLNHCIHLRECFDYRGHICIVTDLLKISLYDYMENNKFIPYPGSHIQSVSKQLIRSVTFLHDLNLIHTDLKPENILLHDDSFVKKPLVSKTLINSYMKLSNCDIKKTPKFSKVLKDTLIQIIDFGSAIFNDEYHSSIVSTRHYRAPEIVLGIGWSFPCDMWSIGCILVELIIGEPLFRTHDNLEHLAMIEKFCGYRIDKSMVKRLQMNNNECGLKHFTEESDLTRLDDDDNDLDDGLTLIFPTPSTPKAFVDSVAQFSRIDHYISSALGLSIDFDYSLNYNYERNKEVINFGNFCFWWFLIDLLKSLFIINPKNRLTAQEAMNHPWFELGIEDEGTM